MLGNDLKIQMMKFSPVPDLAELSGQHVEPIHCLVSQQSIFCHYDEN